jgi:hypothetical protein
MTNEHQVGSKEWFQELKGRLAALEERIERIDGLIAQRKHLLSRPIENPKREKVASSMYDDQHPDDFYDTW